MFVIPAFLLLCAVVAVAWRPSSWIAVAYAVLSILTFMVYAGDKSAARAGGADTTFVGSVGDDTAGESVRADLARLGVVPLVGVIAGAATGQAVVMVEASGENAILVVVGANSATSTLDERQRSAVRSAKSAGRHSA